MEMKKYLVPLVLLVAGCSDWNENKLEFKDYAQFVASDAQKSGWVPSTLVPASAKNISLTTNVDLNDAMIEFDFDSSQEASLLQEFALVPDAQQKRLTSEDLLRASATTTSTLSVRCETDSVEFLLVADHAHAHYWTTRSDRIRGIACPKK